MINVQDRATCANVSNKYGDSVPFTGILAIVDS